MDLEIQPHLNNKKEADLFGTTCPAVSMRNDLDTGKCVNNDQSHLNDASIRCLGPTASWSTFIGYNDSLIMCVPNPAGVSQ